MRNWVLVAASMGACLATAACGNIDDLGQGSENGEPAVEQAISRNPFGKPAGLTCGLSYRNGSNWIADETCDYDRTLSSAAHANWTKVSDGDHGLASGSGYYHQRLNVESGLISPSTADWASLPQGTACGFKHTANSTAERCFGYDAQYQCPYGWTRRTAADAKSGGHYWAWCEYQDIHNVCPAGSACAVSGQYQGTVCGITDTQIWDGTCLGKSTAGKECPSGYRWRGAWDNGRSSGHGLAYCVRI